MKFIRLVVFALFLCPFAVHAAPVTEFTVASQLLAAARNADIRQVQSLVAAGANINFVDSTGLSLVCTALMNNDLRAAQILQMYGADASKCDQQIRKYRSRRAPERTGGLFGGLSTAQGMTLAAAGAAVVVGGLFLLTDVFDAENDNGYTGSGAGGGGGSSGGGGDNAGVGVPVFANGLPYGPLLPNAAAESKNYAENLSYYAPADTTSILYKNFQFMNQQENYLLLMRGYSPLARGYLGMRTLRDSNTYAPLSLADYGLGPGYPVEGGRPVNVALVTANGVNAAANTSLADKLLVWTMKNGSSNLLPATTDMISSKYYNNTIVSAETISGYTTAEDNNYLSYFDLSSSGTAVYNNAATAVDNVLAKIVGGNTAGYSNADYIGFMPNGQMTIYRTGGGTHMVSLASPLNVGTCSMAGTNLATGDTVTLFGEELNVTVNGYAVTLSNENETRTYRGYMSVGNPYLYIDSDGDGRADGAYVMNAGTVFQYKKLEQTDYYNYSAMVDALGRLGDTSVNLGNGRSGIDIIANVDVIEPLHSSGAATIETVLSAGAGNYETKFGSLIALAYGDSDTNNLPQTKAESFFNSLGSTSYPPLTIFSTGASITSEGWPDAPLAATFENAAPLVYSNLEHLFMSVVAVGASTVGESGIVPNTDTNTNQFQLAQWAVNNPDTGATYYKARVCGLAGLGGNGVDPWCFAAVGVTDEMATAAAAGAAGVLTSAFYYMTPQQIFLLMALTADGPFLGRLSSGQTLTESALVSYLESMYQMPALYQWRIDNNNENYLDVFKEVFGYGVINLERATTPGTNLYFYSGGDIVSTSGNAYWRAATTTGFRGSGALNLGRAAISTAAYDVLESVDGTMRLPRIWKNNFTLGSDGRHALYMGDVLGDLRVRANDDNMTRVGNMSFGFTRGERNYDDGMGGVDNMRFEYANDSWKFSADYQRYLTDGESRFGGASNPIFGLASNAMSVGTEYKYGNLFFGARSVSGAITDEGLLANDPTISANLEPMKLGNFSAVQSSVGWRAKNFGLTTSFGVAHESDTLLGASGTGLLGLGVSETRYIDADAYWNLFDDVCAHVRATFARTTPGVDGGAIISLSELDSNAFSLGVDAHNFSLGVSLPLAVRHGKMYYDYADYDIVTDDEDRYDLVISNAGVRDIDLRPESREVRFNASYRQKLDEFTDGALGFIYRVNPNNTHEFGNESIFMMKMSHRIGI